MGVHIIMKQKIQSMRETIEARLASVSSTAELREIRSAYLSRTGEIPALMKLLGSLPKEERPEAGKHINEFKNWATERIEECEATLATKELAERYEREAVDITMPAEARPMGALHPVTLVRDELVRIFAGMGFIMYEGREIEDDYHNFTALNQPKDHPARDKQDTFYVTDDILLRTHTSPGQIHMMETTKPPFKAVMPGRVFRCDDDATHAPMFHQIEGLVIDKGVTMSDLKGTLETLMKKLYGEDCQIRLRPHYFPFTEPSAEVDIMCFNCGGKGCPMCKNEGWIEVLGAGMVHPKVLEICGIDSNEYGGFAFGLGLERIVMRRFGIKDIRLLIENDLRFLEQF